LKIVDWNCKQFKKCAQFDPFDVVLHTIPRERERHFAVASFPLFSGVGVDKYIPKQPF
jgi:hypothetical protein